MTVVRALLTALAGLAFAGCARPAAAPAPSVEQAERPRRIVSLDYCADQFVLRLAPRDSIAALSPHAGKVFSYMKDEAEGVPRVRSRIEDVLALKPDLVVRAYGGGPGAEAALRRAGVRVVTLGYAEDMSGARRNVRQMGLAIGEAAAAEAVIRDMDKRLAAVKPLAGGAVLYLTPTGVTSGPGSQISNLIEAAGLTNFERRPGWRPLPIERLAYETPDIVAAAFFEGDENRRDLWSAARHPVLRKRLARTRMVQLKGAWTTCGGWFMVDAVEALANADSATERAGR